MKIEELEGIQAYERNLLWVFALAAENSPYLNQTQKAVIENKLREIADVWTGKNYV